MRKELGKWLMDIAKYIATTVILAAFFKGDRNIVWSNLLATVFMTIFLVSGTFFVRSGEKEAKPKRSKKRKSS